MARVAVLVAMAQPVCDRRQKAGARVQLVVKLGRDPAYLGQAGPWHVREVMVLDVEAEIETGDRCEAGVGAHRGLTVGWRWAASGPGMSPAAVDA